MRYSFTTLLLFVCGLALPIVGAAQQQALHQFIDQWHLGAAQADSAVFFGGIHPEGVYIGTDASERWGRQAFWAFAKPHFARGKAWDFKPYDRQLHLSDDGRYAWFSELLDTWMGVCRGSGVLQRHDGAWKIRQYHLSVTVPNELVKDFIDLVDKAKKE